MVSSGVVREVLRRAGRLDLMEKIRPEAEKNVALKRRDVAAIEAKLNEFEGGGAVVVKRRRDGKGVILYGKEHIRWRFTLNKVSREKHDEITRAALKKQGKAMPVARIADGGVVLP